MILTCTIIEDEPLAIEKLEGFIKKIPFLQLNAAFDNPLNGLKLLQTKSTDVLFLDIQMEQLTGIQLLESIQKKPYVIITSAYDQYALKGYELQVFDYLLKPFSFERFLSAVNKVYNDALQKHSSLPMPNHIFVKDGYKIENICIDDILYIEGMREYLQIVLNNKKIYAKQSFSSFLKELSDSRFVQVHKSWAVSIPKIESIENNRIHISGKTIPIGDVYKEKFYSLIIKKTNQP